MSVLIMQVHFSLAPETQITSITFKYFIFVCVCVLSLHSFNWSLLIVWQEHSLQVYPVKSTILFFFIVNLHVFLNLVFSVSCQSTDGALESGPDHVPLSKGVDALLIWLLLVLGNLLYLLCYLYCWMASGTPYSLGNGGFLGISNLVRSLLYCCIWLG